MGDCNFKYMRKVYLDNAASTRLDERVKQAILPYLEEYFGNPQSLHDWGVKVKEAIENARVSCANLIGVKSEEIYFTSSGSESNNLAIKGIALANSQNGKHIVTSSIEHFSILHPCKTLEKQGFKVNYLPVDKFGIINVSDLKKTISPETILVSIQFANSEIGTIQPIKEIGDLLKEINKGRIAKKLSRIIFHTDAVAACGNIPIDANEFGIDSLTLAANQFYGPKGAAVLFIRKGTRVIPQIEGGIQEDGRRAGTENVPAIVGLGKAAELAKVEMQGRSALVIALRDKLIKELPQKIERIYLNGHPTNRLPNNAHFCIEYIEGEGMLLMLNMKGIAVSSGSACTSRALKASHVLIALGMDHALAQGSILFSFGRENTEEDVNYVIEELTPIVKKLREMSPLYAKAKEKVVN